MPFGSGGLLRVSSPAHLSTSAPLSGSGTSPISGRSPETTAWRRSRAVSGFPSAFARRPWLLGHPFPARGFRSPRGRPTAPPSGGPDSVGVSVFRMCELRPGWVPSLLRGGGVLPTGTASPVGACRFPAASPVPHWNHPPVELLITEHAKIHSRSPVRPFPRPSSPGGTGTLRLLPRASHPAVTHDARQGGNSPMDTGPDHYLTGDLQTA